MTDPLGGEIEAGQSLHSHIVVGIDKIRLKNITEAFAFCGQRRLEVLLLLLLLMLLRMLLNMVLQVAEDEENFESVLSFFFRCSPRTANGLSFLHRPRPGVNEYEEEILLRRRRRR